MLVSILLAVRNEENNILACLKSLAAQDFPQNEFEILIGDDGSGDKTRELVLAFIKDKPFCNLIDIQGYIGNARYKGNVIAQLAHHAKGTFFLITDADMSVPPSWIKGMITGFQQKENIGIVTGFSLVKGKSLLSKLDGVDWILNVGLMNVASVLGIPTNSMGNNMAVRQLAYWEMGGIENRPYMVSEDMIMFRGITEKGWGFIHLHTDDIVGISKPPEGFYQLLQQRQRWLDGAIRLPLFLLMPLLLNGLFLFFLIFMLFINTKIALVCWFMRFVFHTTVIVYFSKFIKQYWTWYYLPFYEIFITFFNPLVFIFYLLPIPIQWKEK
jgi:cellulose synthase/poly-beta-1,6-N-acetylglucosamine synthase-like glycosyltransferase